MYLDFNYLSSILVLIGVKFWDAQDKKPSTPLPHHPQHHLSSSEPQHGKHPMQLHLTLNE
jgi:hypothetical protein